MDNGDVLIRPYDGNRDREAVRDCFKSGFGQTTWPLWEYSDVRAIDDMIELDVRICSVNLVADVEGIARGVLLGQTSMGALSAVREISLLAAFMNRRLLLDRKAMRPFARINLLRVVSGELPYYVHSPRGKAAEIYDLTSMEGYRGGIGRAMVDAFVQKSREAGLKRVDVGTDSELSWGFYESYGFKRVREFPIHIYDFSLPGKKVTGYIYSLDI